MNKSIVDYFSGYTLTDDQKRFCDSIGEFLRNDTNCFILNGYAGTGKTFLMKGLTTYLSDVHRMFRLAAPTGRAAKVISVKTKHEAMTIHRAIYSNSDLREFKTANKEGTETFKFYYNLKLNQDTINTVYIIDEASMLSDVYSEGEFFRFGTGYLLQDLIRYINFDNSDHKKKLIFIGDNAQLPPIGMKMSPALNKDYLKSNCGLSVQEYELTEVVRQSEDSGILANATKLRESLKESVFNEIKIDSNYDDVNLLKNENILPKYITLSNNEIGDDVMIISHSNEDVKAQNDVVREHFFPGKKDVAAGDKVMIVGNNYNYGIELLNGDIGRIIDVHSESESRRTTLRKTNNNGVTNEVEVVIKYKDVTLLVDDIDGNPVEIRCKVLEDLLESKDRDISSDMQKAMYIDYWIRHPKLNRIKQLLYARSVNFQKLNSLIDELSIVDITPEIAEKIAEYQADYFRNPQNDKTKTISVSILSEALRADAYFNAIKMKYGYAATCHKAQGGEWENVILNCKASMSTDNSTYFRWLYTGMTRAKSELHLMNAPDFTVGSDLTILSTDNASQHQPNVIALDKEAMSVTIPFDFDGCDPTLKHIFYAVKEAIEGVDVSIKSIKHKQYAEHYAFVRGEEIIKIIVNYNGQFKISSIRVGGEPSEFSKEIKDKLSSLKGKFIVDTTEVIEPTEAASFTFNQDFLEKFYLSTLSKLSNSGIKITNIESYEWHEVYTFSKGGFEAVYKFYYNKKKQIKSAQVVGNRTTGLTEELNTLLTKDVE